MFRRCLIIALTVAFGSQISRAADGPRRLLEYAPAARGQPAQGPCSLRR